MAKKLTIQIVGWNHAAVLPATLATLQTIPHDEVAIRYIDNGSQDGSAQVARQALPAAEIIALPTNTGFAGAHNLGFARCATELVLVHNPDFILDWTGVAKVLEVFADPRVGAAQGILYRDVARTIIDSAGIVLTPALNGVDRGAGQRDGGQFSAVADLDAVTGAAGVYRLSALREVAHAGGEVFDEDFFAYKEDVDLGWRMRRAGWRIVFVPVAMGIHSRGLQPGTLLSRLGDARTRYSLRNWVWMLIKNMRGRDMVRHGIFVEARLLFFMLLSLVAWPLLRAWRDIFRGLPRITAKTYEA